MDDTQEQLLSPAEESRIATALDIERQIERLREQKNSLLEPIVKRIVDTGDRHKMIKLAGKLPAGFHRAELRTIILKLGQTQ